MAEIKIGQDQIDGLAKKLDEFSEVLDENERALLLAVFGIASTALSQANQESEAAGGRAIRGTQSITSLPDSKMERPVAAALPKLSAGFRNAFTSGAAGRFKFAGVGPVADVAVGGTTVTWSA